MSYAIYVGRDLTATGTGFLAGYGDEPSSHWLELVPAARHQPGTTITVGATPDADMPARLSEIPQAEETFRHLRVSYSYYKGTPAPLTNGGVNAFGVAVRDVWSPSRPELVALTPASQSGPNYSDLCKSILERARTAREGVELIGSLTAEHGHVTYGGNSHLIADENEAWVVIEFAGGQGLWAAERLGSRSIRVSRPGYIGEIPLSGGGEDHLYADNLVSFAVEQGWFDAAAGRPFNVNEIYGDGKMRWEGVRWVEDQLQKLAGTPAKITFQDIASLLRTPRLTGDTAGYGQIVPLCGEIDPALRLMWHAPVGASAAPLLPVFLGIDAIPAEYRQHRYLTDGEAARFVDGRNAAELSAVPRGVEAAASAVAVFKRLMYLAFEHPGLFLPELHAAWEALEGKLQQRTQDAAALARLAIAAGEHDLAHRHLTAFTQGEMLRALRMAEDLATAMDIRRQLQFGVTEDPVPQGPEQIW